MAKDRICLSISRHCKIQAELLKEIGVINSMSEAFEEHLRRLSMQYIPGYRDTYVRDLQNELERVQSISADLEQIDREREEKLQKILSRYPKRKDKRHRIAWITGPANWDVIRSVYPELEPAEVVEILDDIAGKQKQ